MPIYGVSRHIGLGAHRKAEVPSFVLVDDSKSIARVFRQAVEGNPRTGRGPETGIHGPSQDQTELGVHECG